MRKILLPGLENEKKIQRQITMASLRLKLRRCSSPFILCIVAMILWMNTSSVYAVVDRLNACKEGRTIRYDSDDCVCNLESNNPNARCVNMNNLEAIPRGIPSITKALIVAGNTKLKELHQDDFRGLENLESLFLGTNAIAEIHPLTFRNMYKLKRLDLNDNPIVHFDPSGRTLQHLTSLVELYMTKAEITKLNKFTFFTLGAPNQNLKVFMDYNPVQCDCNVKALKNWQNELVPTAITFKNLRCSNANDMDYKDPNIDDSIFDNCTNSAVNLFQTRPVCYDCSNEKTNYACKQQNSISCQGAEWVCYESVKWDAGNKRMSISSGCVAYQDCLALTASNKISCGLGYQPNILCSFCCLGPTCDFTTIGGRTVDYTFDLRYIRNAQYELFMEDRQSSDYNLLSRQIDEGITAMILGIEAGYDIYVERFEPEDGNTHKVVIRVEVTALSVTSQDEILAQIKEKMKTDSQAATKFLQEQKYQIGSFNTVPISPANVPSNECRNETTKSSTGTYVWPTTVVGRAVNLRCQSTSSNSNNFTFAVRKCTVDLQQQPKWSIVSEDKCKSPPVPQPQPTIDELEQITITNGNALTVSNMLINSISSEESFTSEEVHKAVNVLEKLVTVEMLAVSGVPNNVVSAVSHLIDVDKETLRKAQEEESTSQRLLSIIDGVAAMSPLTENRLVISAPNIAVAAQGVGPQESRNVIMTTGDSSQKNVQIGVKLQSASQANENTGISIPTKAVVASLPQNQRQNIKRVTFAAHKDDKLFYVPTNTKEDQVQVRQVDDDNKYIFKTQVNSQIIAASIPGIAVPVRNLQDNVTMTFIHDSSNASDPQCVSWNQSLAGGHGDWSSEGCGVVETSNTSTTCGCSHLTNFALLMDVYQEGGGLSATDRKVLSILSYLGCGVSLLALLITLLTYSFFRTYRQYDLPKNRISARKLRRDNPSKILINLCLALFLSNLVFLVGMQDYAFDNITICKIVAVLLHYFLLASLTWMAVEAFYMYLALVLVFKTYFTHFILKCSLIGWGIPFVIVVITLAVDSTDNYGFVNSGLCWLQNPAFYAAFVAPVCIILLINCAAFGMVIRQLVNMSSGKITKTDRSSTVQRLRGAIGIAILLGLSWIFAVFAIDSASVVFYYLFAIFNSLQGLFIFIFYCLLKKDAISSWKRKLPCFDEYGESSKTSSNSRDKAKDAKKGAATVTGHQNMKLNTNSGSSISPNTLSTDSTVASHSRNSSNVYNSIDDQETERLNHNTDYNQMSNQDRVASPTSTHLLSARGSASDSICSIPELSHVYANIPSKHQMPHDAASPPQNSTTARPAPEDQYSNQDANISIISQNRQNNPQGQHQNSASVNPKDISVNVDAHNGPRVRDLRMQYDRRTSNTSDVEITRI